MKKILLILIAFSSFSFAGWTEFDCSRVSSKLSTYHTIYEGPLDTNGKCYENGLTLLGIGGARFSIINDNNPSCTSALVTDDYTFECNENGNYGDYRPNGPENSIGLDENGKPICDSGYSNQVLNDENVCSLTPPNSNGFNPDNTPDCKDGFINDNGFCIPKPDCSALVSECSSSCLFGVATFGCTDGVETAPCTCNTPPPPKINSDGSITETNSENGNTTTTYPDGSSETHDINGNPIGSTESTNGTSGLGSSNEGGTNGVGGQSGTTGSGGSGETSDGSGDDEDYTPPSVANSCSDTSLTLEQKMLCELNQGMKNQNSEGNPANSLNNLLKDMDANNVKDNKAMNDNLKDLKTNTTITNARLTAVNAKLGSLKTINQQIISNGNKTNEELAKFSTNETTPDMTDLNNNSSWVSSIANTYTTFTNNLSSQNDTFVNFANTTKNTISNGFTISLVSAEMVNCPTTYDIDLSSLGQDNIILNIDFCSQTSKLRPYLYPFILIILMIGIVMFTIKMIGSI